MDVETTPLSGVMLIKPKVFGDDRGFFLESWNRCAFAEAGIPSDFVQDNHSRSRQGILRGLHFQTQQPQGKLVRVISGSVYDVTVDLRTNSATFGQWFGCLRSAENKTQLWVPPGFAHGFFTLSEHAEVLYKTTDFWSRDCERAIRWDDPQLAIRWPTTAQPLLSEKAAMGPLLTDLSDQDLFS